MIRTEDPLFIIPGQRCADVLIGTGGIGSGMVFQMHDNTTLGREESRGGVLLDRKDYCKLHIITHYVRRLLGPSFSIFPVGAVGSDAIGAQLLREMDETGLSGSYVRSDPLHSTLFSFCFVYPDGSGGNMTTGDSASAHVDDMAVARTADEFRRAAGRGIALAAPEVALEARQTLLELATIHRFYRVASFTSEEMRRIVKSDLLRMVDLLAINLDEAAAGADLPMAVKPAESIVRTAVALLTGINPGLQVSITQGRGGSWIWDGSGLTQMPALSVPVESTAGAGDAFTAGLIAGRVAGLSLPHAQQLATLVAADSVTSPHTINHGTARTSLLALARTGSDDFAGPVLSILQEPP